MMRNLSDAQDNVRMFFLGTVANHRQSDLASGLYPAWSAFRLRSDDHQLEPR